MQSTSTTPQQPTLRTATMADIVTRLTNTDYEWTAITALGWGMGDAQHGITTAVTAAETAGLVRIKREHGKTLVQLAPKAAATPTAQTISLAAGYLRNHTRHGEHDAWLTHGRDLAGILGLTGDTWSVRQQLPAAAKRIATPAQSEPPRAPLPPVCHQLIAKLNAALHPAATR